MSPDITARLFLTLYALIALGIISAQVVRSGVGLSASFLHALNRAYCGLWFHWRANRRSPFPQSGPALIYGNHRSPVDPLLIWMNHHLGDRGRGPLRVISFLMAREYYEKPGLSWLCRAMQSIPADRDGRDIGPAKEALSRLKAGDLVGVFPEGRINTGPGLGPFGTGFAWLALRSEVPVYPVYLHDSPQHKSMIAPFVHPCRVRVTFGDPIDLSPWYGNRSREALDEVTSLLRRKLAELGGLPPTAPHIAETPAEVG